MGNSTKKRPRLKGKPVPSMSGGLFNRHCGRKKEPTIQTIPNYFSTLQYPNDWCVPHACACACASDICESRTLQYPSDWCVPHACTCAPDIYESRFICGSMSRYTYTGFVLSILCLWFGLGKLDGQGPGEFVSNSPDRFMFHVDLNQPEVLRPEDSSSEQVAIVTETQTETHQTNSRTTAMNDVSGISLPVADIDRPRTLFTVDLDRPHDAGLESSPPMTIRSAPDNFLLVENNSPLAAVSCPPVHSRTLFTVDFNQPESLGPEKSPGKVNQTESFPSKTQVNSVVYTAV